MDRWIASVFFLFLVPRLESSTQSVSVDSLKYLDRVEASLQAGKEEFSHGEFTEALLKFELAKSITEERDLWMYKGHVNMWLGNAYQETGKYAKAREAYLAAIESALAINDSFLVHRIHISLGGLESSQGFFEPARKYLKEALVFFTERSDSAKMISASNNLGYAYLQNFQLDSAKLILESSLDLATAYGDTLEMAKIHINLGSLYFTMVQEDIASSHYEKAIDLLDQLGMQMMTRSIYVDLVRLYSYTDERDKLSKTLSRYDAVFDSYPEESKHFFTSARELVKEPPKLINTERVVWFFLLLVVGFGFYIYSLRIKSQLKIEIENQKFRRPENPIGLFKEQDTLSKSDSHIKQLLKPLFVRDARDRVNVLLTLFYYSKETNKNSIALDLGVSPSTIGRYCSIIESELEITDVRKFAITHGLDRLDLEDYKRIIGIY